MRHATRARVATHDGRGVEHLTSLLTARPEQRRMTGVSVKAVIDDLDTPRHQLDLRV